MKKILTLAIAVLMLALLAVAASAAVGTVVYAQKVDEAPNLEKIDASWGQAIIHVDKNSENTVLADYYQIRERPDILQTVKCEDVSFDLYAVWTKKYLYIGIITDDYDICGDVKVDCGDGMEFWLQPLDAMVAQGTATSGLYEIVNETGKSENTINQWYVNNCSFIYICTLSMDDWSVSRGQLPPYTSFGSDMLDNEPTSYQEGNTLHFMMEIPLGNYGIKDGEGVEFGIAFLRQSLETQGASYGANARSGWLEWGKYYKNTNTVTKSVNTLVLTSSAPETTPPPATETNPPVDEPNLDGVSSWAKEEVEAGIKEGLVPTELQQNYTTPVTRGQVAQMFINLLEKATGKTVDDIMAEKGVAINENAFTDTTDKAVLAANALGIINGTGNGKFSPNGTLKRAQIAAIINRVAKVMGVETEGYTHEFTDITDNYKWADSELGWPVYAGIINGVGGGKFNPGGDLTTEQAILITYRGLNALRPAAAE